MNDKKTTEIPYTPCKYWEPNPMYEPDEKHLDFAKEPGVECKGKANCNTCGWNPVVAQKRKERGIFVTRHMNA